MIYNPNSEVINRFFELKSIGDIVDLLNILAVRNNHKKITVHQLRYHLYELKPEKKYRTFYIQKKSVGFRQISAPVSAIKLIQKNLNQVLQYVYQPVDSVVHGFVKEKNIVTNATIHCNKFYKSEYLFNIDLLNFFPSINFGRVRGMFIANPYGLPPKVATILAQICCFNNELPQGAPTSPIISNMICRNLDNELTRFAYDFRCNYSRYADDLTFSTALTSGFPPQIVNYRSREHLKIGDSLFYIIKKNGFKINFKKVRLQDSSCRQEVTGIVINSGHLNVRRSYVRQIRAMFYAWKKFGLTKAQEHFDEKYDTKKRNPWSPSPSFTQVIKGKLEFIKTVKGSDDPIYLKFKEEFIKLTDSNEENRKSSTLPNKKSEEITTQIEENIIASPKTLPESNNTETIPLSFELLLEKRDDNRFQVRVLSPQEAEYTEIINFPYTNEDFIAIFKLLPLKSLKELQKKFRNKENQIRRLEELGFLDPKTGWKCDFILEKFGNQIFKSLFPGKIEGYILSTLKRLNASKKTIYVDIKL
ncbi:MAG: reverse transcriptase domain-containing protein, partial [Pleurocapsa sp. MO_192.B19]|nr:reverse transcriptase domain-containing protein [Pleurocapsa sp. MO_192.B19]